MLSWIGSVYLVNKSLNFYRDDDGRRYEGMWEDNNKHGEGQMVYSDGTVRRGIWKNDELEKWID